MQSFVFDFEKSPTFFKKWNKEFDVEDINSNCFYIVLADDVCDDNIEDVLNADGQVKYDESHLIQELCRLNYVEVDKDTAHILLDGETSISLVNDFNMKGCFLTTDSGYVIGYSINTFSLNISSGIIFEDGLYFFSLVEGDVNG